MDIREAQVRNRLSKFRHPWELARLEVVKYFLKKVTKGINSKKINIIDIGCGDLFILESLSKSYNFNSTIGVDTAYDHEAIKNYEANSHISLFNSIDKVSIPKNEVSIILLLDVIEHIEEDGAFLKNILGCDFINEDTIFIITVPSFQSLFSAHDEFLLHYRRYSNSQLKELLVTSNYNIIKNGYFFTSLLIQRFLAKTISGYFGKTIIKKNETELSTWNKGWLSTFLLKNILLIDFYFFNLLGNIKIPGLSNYAICKKSV